MKFLGFYFHFVDAYSLPIPSRIDQIAVSCSSDHSFSLSFRYPHPRLSTRWLGTPAERSGAEPHTAHATFEVMPDRILYLKVFMYPRTSGTCALPATFFYVEWIDRFGTLRTPNFFLSSFLVIRPP